MSATDITKLENMHEELPRCVSQDPSANSQRSLSSTRLELDDLIGTVLGQGFKIGERIHDEKDNNHFVAFAVHQDHVNISATTNGANGLVARIYDMNNLTPNHKRYKIRSINRSAGRTVFRTTWSSCQIIILKMGRLGDPQSCIDTETARFDTNSPKLKTDDEQDCLNLGISRTRVAYGEDGQQVIPAPSSMISNAEQKHKPNSKLKHKAKTFYQRESSRLRQRDRRAAKRCQQRYTTSHIGLDLLPRPLSQSLALKKNVHGLDDVTFAMLVMLHFAFNPRPELRTRLPHATRTQIERFLATRNEKVVLTNDDEKLEFVQIKESELVGLRRLTNKLNGLTQQCHDEFLGLLEEQRSSMKGSTEWRHLQEKLIKPRKHWYMVLLSASKILPRLTTESEDLINSLKRELKEASELKEKRRILNHRQWIHHLIPGSETYNQLWVASD